MDKEPFLWGQQYPVSDGSTHGFQDNGGFFIVCSDLGTRGTFSINIVSKTHLDSPSTPHLAAALGATNADPLPVYTVVICRNEPPETNN